MANVIVTAAVTQEVVTFEDVKTNARIEGDDENDFIRRRLKMAREMAEKLTRRSIGEQTLQLRVADFGSAIELLRPPVLSVTSVKYLDAADAEQTLSSSLYYVDLSGVSPVIRWVPNSSLPTLSLRSDAVRVNYTAGYTSATCPEMIRGWIEMCAAQLIENRELSAERVAQTHPWIEHALTTVSEIGY